MTAESCELEQAMSQQLHNERDTERVLIKLLVGDATCALNASRAEKLLDTQTRTHDSTKRLGIGQGHENQ